MSKNICKITHQLGRNLKYFNLIALGRCWNFMKFSARDFQVSNFSPLKFFKCHFLKFLILFSVINFIASVHLTHVQIPEFADIREVVTLSCSYILRSNKHLNSVKFYKDGMEFFRSDCERDIFYLCLTNCFAIRSDVNFMMLCKTILTQKFYFFYFLKLKLQLKFIFNKKLSPNSQTTPSIPMILHFSTNIFFISISSFTFSHFLDIRRWWINKHWIGQLTVSHCTRAIHTVAIRQRAVLV